MRVPFSYLDRQFGDLEAYLGDLRAFVPTGDFTLGKPLTQFEEAFAAAVGLPHAVGVGTGTDAIALTLHALGVGPGAEVITTPMTFVATVGAIVQVGARPVFVDSEDGFVIDPDRIEAAITPKTKAIVPVHYTGNAADMPRIAAIAERHGLGIVEDACQAIGARIGGEPVGSWGAAAAFSLHPLKNLNVWGDAGIIATRSAELARELRLLRNHGLEGRDTVVRWGFNCRMDTLQAVIGNRLIQQLGAVTERRVGIARRYDEAFAKVPGVHVPVRRPGVRHVFHLYMFRSDARDALLAHLIKNGVEAKVHYPVPMHLQPAALAFGYTRGDFPVTEETCDHIVTVPAHPYLTDAEVDHVIAVVQGFSA